MDIDVQVAPAAAPATDREHLGTVLFGLWMTIGLFLDGYFHQNLETESESFLTPWHAVFYAGFAASALWMAAMSRRRAPGQVDWLLSSLPPGYGGARLGLGLFALGGVGDALWHAAFGVERGVDALLSPTHLVLFAGLVLILTAPVRAVRFAPEAPPRPWLVVGSVTSAAALVGFFLNFAWGLGIAAFTRVGYDPISEVGETEVIAGVASTIVTTLVLCGAARTLLSTGRPPAGAMTVLFGIVALLVSAAFDEDAEGVAAALAAGVLLDVVLGSRARGTNPTSAGAAFAAGTAVLWGIYFGLLEALDGMAWQAEIWMGALVLNALLGYAIAVLPTTSVQARPEGAT
jgi:hypothetical protein